MTARHAVIVGAGIGGLCAAVGLHRAGWRVTVLDRAPSPEPLGTCIGLAPNALRALDGIGIGEKFREFGIAGNRGGIRSPDGRWLTHRNPQMVSDYFGEPFVLARRGALTRVLLAALPDSVLHNGIRVTGAHRNVVRTDRGEFSGDLIVGADGIHSAVRGTLFPWYGAPRSNGMLAWRFVLPAGGPPCSGSETWGAGQYFGIMPLAAGTTYCFASAPKPRGAWDSHTELAARFGSWHEPIPELIAAAGEDLLCHELFRLDPPPARFHHGSTVLLGDAAHAMLPNLGQGGCQAIEDAATLAALLSGNRPIAEALERYSALRVPRTRAIAANSARASRIAGLRSPFAVAARDALVRASNRLPDSLVLRGMAAALDWWPPDQERASTRAR